MLSQDRISETAKQNRFALPIEFMPGHDFHLPEQKVNFLAPAPGLKELASHDYQPQTQANVPSGTASTFVCLYLAKLLTVEQEFHLFRKMNYLKHLAEQHRLRAVAENRSANNKIQPLLNQANAIRNYIVTANLRLVISIAKKLVDSSNPLEDLFAQGTVPLIRAVEIFNFERGTRFSTYATWAVRNQLYRITGKNRKYDQRQITGEAVYLESRPDFHAKRSDSESAQVHVYDLLASVIDKLSQRDRIIVSERFGLFAGDSPRTFREIGQSLGISTERVRQLLHRSLEKLKRYLDERDFEMQL